MHATTSSFLLCIGSCEWPWIYTRIPTMCQRPYAGNACSSLKVHGAVVSDTDSSSSSEMRHWRATVSVSTAWLLYKHVQWPSLSASSFAGNLARFQSMPSSHSSAFWTGNTLSCSYPEQASLHCLSTDKRPLRTSLCERVTGHGHSSLCF